MEEIVQLTKLTDCKICRGCCVFSAADRYFAPLCARKEIPRKFRGRVLNQKYFSGHGDGVFQARTEKIRGKDFYKCIFFDKHSGHCRLSRSRPLDCKLFPFLLSWNKAKNSVGLYLFDKTYCPSLARAVKEELTSHTKDILSFLKSKKVLDFYSKYPDLIWERQVETKLVKNIYSFDTIKKRFVNYERR